MPPSSHPLYPSHPLHPSHPSHPLYPLYPFHPFYPSTPSHNHLFPFLITEVKKWKCSDPDITSGISADSDRFAALWLQNKTLTQEAQQVIDAAREMYKEFYEKSALLNTNKYKVGAWDAGLYQIKACLTDEEYNLDNDYSSFTTALKNAMKVLEAKIDTEKYFYGFIE